MIMRSRGRALLATAAALLPSKHSADGESEESFDPCRVPGSLFQASYGKAPRGVAMVSYFLAHLYTGHSRKQRQGHIP